MTQAKKNKLTIKESLISLLLVIPMFTHWLLPSGMESMLYYSMGIGYFYLPNVCYFIYLFSYKSLHNQVVYTRKQKTVFLFLIVILFLFSLFQILLSQDVDEKNETFFIINNLSFVYLPFIFFCFPLDHNHIRSLRFYFLIVWFIICVEVILLSLGVAIVGHDMTEGLTADYAGVFRVHTTVGASTGTSVVVYIMGILLTSFFNYDKKISFVVIILTSIAVLYSVSRGAILAWGIYVVLFFYRDYFKKARFKWKIFYLIIALVSIVALYQYHFFDPIIARNEMKDKSTMMSGRSELSQEALKVAEESNYMGVGPGNVFPDKSIIEEIKIRHYVRIHNLYLLYLAENGIIGCFFILLILALSLRGLDYYQTYTWLLVAIFGISCSTEMIFAWAEFMPLLLIYILCCKKNKDEVTVFDRRLSLQQSA